MSVPERPGWAGRPTLLRVLKTVVWGAVIGGLAVVLVAMADPSVVFEMDRSLPRSTSGFSPAERDADVTFSWTSGRAVVRLSGLDRGGDWTCTLRMRGARPAGVEQPTVAVLVDDRVVASARATNQYDDLVFTAPEAAHRRALRLTITSTPAFRPGGNDPRELGVQVDRLACAPVAMAFPPPRAVLSASASVAAFAVAMGLAGVPPLASVIAVSVLALGQAATIALPAALYGGHAEFALLSALWMAGGLLALTISIERWRGVPMTSTAKVALACSGGIMWLQSLALLHPLKLQVDALFQAHRLQWVLDGRYFFTQPMPSGVEFPYAIALYVFAAPWTLLTSDHVALLRIVVLAVQAVAGACLYRLVAAAWHDRRAAVAAVLLFHLVPLPYVVIGNGNLTNMFGQSVATIVITAAAGAHLSPRRLPALAGLAALVGLGLLAHVSTFALLLGTLTMLVALLAWRGGRDGRAAASAIAIAALVATLASVAVYYRHFGDVYAHALGTVRTAAPGLSSGEEPADGGGPTVERPIDTAAHAAGPGLPQRVRVALAQVVRDIGWPMLLLAFAGGWFTFHQRDRAVLAVAAWLVLWTAGTSAVLVTRVGAEFERYAIEFLGRINLAAYPAAVLLAARAGGEAWQRRRSGATGAASALAIAALIALAVVQGIDSWLTWMR
jgi:hypothetical protein